MLRLRAYADNRWFCRDFATLAQVRVWWCPRKPLFGLLELSGSAPVSPAPWQFGPGKLLVTEETVSRHAPTLRVVRHPDGGLPIVVDKLFPQVEASDASQRFRLPEMPAHPPPSDIPTPSQPPHAPGCGARGSRPPKAARPPEPLVERAYPSWFAETPVARLDLPERFSRSLAAYESVAALMSLDVGAILTLKGHGRGSVQRLRESLDATFRALGAERIAGPAPYDVSQPLRDFLLRNSDLLGERERRIVWGRLGLFEEPRTLDALGNELGVTRERIRQISVRAFDRLDGVTGCLDLVARSLLFVRHDAPVPFAELRTRPWTAGLGDASLEQVLLLCADLHVIPLSPGLDVVCPFNARTWTRHQASLFGLLAQAAATDVTETVVERFSDFLGNVGERAILVRMAHATLGREPALHALTRLGMVREALDILLPKDGTPLHFDLIKESLGVDGDDHENADKRLAYTLNAHALHLGGNRYARSVSELAPPNLAAPNLAELCEAILGSGARGRRWSTADILSSLRRRDRAAFAHVGVEDLERQLCALGRFDRVRTMCWCSEGTSGTWISPERLAEEILERRGGPMPSAELRKAVTARWGKRKNLQLRSKGRLAILDGNLWGLADRDIPTDAALRNRVVTQAVAAYGRGEAYLRDIHAALQASGALEGIGEALLGTLLRLDAGIVAGKSGDLRREGMPPPRRTGTLKAAVIEALQHAPEGLSARQAAANVVRITGREPSEALVSKALREHARRGESGLWVLDPETVGERPPAPGPRTQRPPNPGKAAPRAPRAPSAKRPAPPREYKGYPKVRKRRERSGPQFAWTTAREKILLSMLSEGRKGSDIARALGHGLTKNAVNAKVYRLGLATPRDPR